MKAEVAIVLYPSPAIGHLISMVELGKLLLAHCPNDSLSVHVLISSQAYNAGSITPYISAVSAAVPSLTFHHLPSMSLPPDFSTTSPHQETLAFELLRLNNPNLREALLSISAAHRTVNALVMDFFCYAASKVARDLSIPCYYFFTSGAGFLASFLYLPTLHEKYSDEAYTNPRTLLDVPGIPPLPVPDVANPLRDRADEAYVGFLESSKSMRESSGIIVNTFDALEHGSIRTITEGQCVPEGPTPPLYCIGPLISDRSRETNGGDAPPECLKWLDAQPSRSVVFLCFGSLGVFSREQLGEIAVGLERSGQRFLWVVRNPPPDPALKVATMAHPDPDLDSLLPEGFLARTGDRGLVVKSWAPQMAVLRHRSMGGFVTHCGWNSTLEAVCAGVPMIAWPLYAEQRQNRLLMVSEEMRIALQMEESEGGFVSLAEVERRVRELMDSPEGEAVRQRTQAMKKAAEAALKPGGSSLSELTRLVGSWKLA
ncbi:UDP-glycosyltransferase 88A1-like [Punica granatum]|uniref:Glycosyltransferase n=2 Tax=Punica granatum TaxID=22663 RepID=A0A2I0K4L3_PUNGR|nr:UDP-glycosyltransferase 88A1-like [Punica granatum]PKI63489.1 hypothetical protein CRG98_016156 [Punica granatum]